MDGKEGEEVKGAGRENTASLESLEEQAGLGLSPTTAIGKLFL